MSDAGMNILYLGPESGTCLDRADALRRIGHNVKHIDTRRLLPKTPWVDRITWRLGGHWFAPSVAKALTTMLEGKLFDCCYVDGGEWIAPRVIAQLKKHAPLVINYNIDDPLGPRDGARYNAYRKSIPLYDLVVVMRQENISEARRFGGKNVLRVYMSADEISHRPRAISGSDQEKWGSDVLFLGTWMPERGPFLVELIRRGVPLTIRGPNWQKAPEWEQLKHYWKGGAVAGDDYAKAIQCAKVNLGLLSKGNRDQHTTRSLEIPALGALLCAERTAEHISMYREGEEALFWKDADECAEMCRHALANEGRRLAIAVAGHARVQANGHYNEPVLASILVAAKCPQ